MNSKQFIASKGNITDPDIRFLNAGQTTIIPLADLLDEYAALKSPAEEAAPKKKVKANTSKKK